MMVIHSSNIILCEKVFILRPLQKITKFDILGFIQSSYEKHLQWAFKKPGFTLGIGIVSVICGIALFTIIPRRLMPFAERNQFAVEIYLPQEMR